ncbi:MAG: sigma factor-like helix-turn-helix DNA-binding protein [Polaribacter sp.]
MTIDEIYKKKEISVRSYHVCKYNNLNSVKDLKEYYFKLKSFDNLPNCGRRSNEELIEICNKYKEEYLEKQELNNKKGSSLKTIIPKLTRIQREAINSFILVNTNDLSVRSKNAIMIHLKKNLNIKNFAEKRLLSDSFNVRYIKSIGTKCVPEIEFYISIIKDFLIKVSESDNEKHLISLKNNFLIQYTFSISKIPNEILESESIFLLTDFLLNQNALYNEAHTIIVKKAFKIYQNQKKLRSNDIAEEVNLTKERIRQIRKRCLSNLFDKLSFIRNFNDDLLHKYNIDVTSNQIEINANVVNIINNTNKTNLSRGFITYILFVYLNNDFTLIGNIADVIQPKYFNSSNRYNWNNLYLIKKELAITIDFNALAKDINNRISNRIEKSYTFSFKSYLSKFLTDNNIDVLDLVFPIAEKIINDEFELYLDLEKNLIFKRNTSKNAYEYAYEALEQLGRPSKVKEIFEKVLELHPNYNTEEAKIRICMKRKDGFVPIGRKSVFGLKKWEKELENFKGGTIRAISEEFLLNFNAPQHKKEIENYVKQFRPKTNANSIYNNLHADESNTFVFYENYYIGLSSKKYPDDFKILSKTASSSKHTWEESLEILKNFIDREKRPPYSSGCLQSEKKLYRWFNIQKRKCYNGKLEKTKEKLITEIVNKL